jgi:predicted transcriptional regulator of viral defense system
MPGKVNLKKAFKLKPVLRSSEFTALGGNRKQLASLVLDGILIRIGRGLYALPEVAEDSRFSLVQASASVPKGVICLLSALRFHGLTTQLTPDIWMALPRGAWVPSNPSVQLRIIVVGKGYWQSHIEIHMVGKAPIRVYSAAKTVIDCFKFRNKIGMDVVVEALRDYVKKNRGGADKLWRLAKDARMQRILQPYLDAML